MKGVFQSKITPSYDDLPEERYHFPKSYLNQVRATIGDLIVYYEPRRSTAQEGSRGGRQSYFASARVTGIRPDPALADHYYADVVEYLSFDAAVPFKLDGFYFESALKGPDGKTNLGSAQRAVRNMPDAEFELILKAGFSGEMESEAASAAVDLSSGFYDPPAEFERPLVEVTAMRPFRDAAFKRQVQVAYDKRCAMTGLRLINGGGRAEAQAAHIRAVAANGPDSVRNGIALSSTFHWLFDRGLVSIDDNFKILRAKGALPLQIEQMLNPTGELSVPADERLQPHRQFLRHHRETVFKG